jgi:hypothetical protein
MPRPTATTALAASLLAMALPAGAGPAESQLRITQRALVTQCMNGTAVPADRRSWTVSAPVTLAVTMRNQPRTGVADADPGTAIITFSPEPGHRYEVEVRADGASFSSRVWTKGAWTPVVRDRTIDRVVSSDPDWAAPPCQPTPAR